MLMALPNTSGGGAGEPTMPPGVALERLGGLSGSGADDATRAIVPVLSDAFDVSPEREPGIEAETLVSLGNPSFTHYLLRFEGQPAAVARRATFDGLSYLSSIGTAAWARGRGFGRLVTAAAIHDALRDGSEWAYLGVYADNQAAIRLYEALGFERVGDPGADLLLV
jgi:predicted GNAT family acetyltransferase